jgi:Transposase DDE domain group 1
VAGLAEDAAIGRVEGEATKVRRYGEFAYAAKTWSAERRVIARIEASDQGADTRFIVTNLEGAPRWLYEAVYCARGQAENLMYGRLPPRKGDLRRSGMGGQLLQCIRPVRGHAAAGLHEIRKSAPDYQDEREARRFSRALPTPVQPVMSSRR